MSRQTRPTTVVSHPPRSSIESGSWRASRSHASCTASSASVRDPRTRCASVRTRARSPSNARAKASAADPARSCRPPARESRHGDDDREVAEVTISATVPPPVGRPGAGVAKRVGATLHQRGLSAPSGAHLPSTIAVIGLHAAPTLHWMTDLAASEITVDLVRRLVTEQHPEWAALPVTPVPRSGVDNRTFRLGDELLVRLPSAAGYAQSVAKEQRWLPVLAQHLPLPIPAPVAAGSPVRVTRGPGPCTGGCPATPLTTRHPRTWRGSPSISGRSSRRCSEHPDRGRNRVSTTGGAAARSATTTTRRVTRSRCWLARSTSRLPRRCGRPR